MKIRGFEKISKQVDNADVQLPKRMTKHSVGYDFFSPVDVVIPAGEQFAVYTGIKSHFQIDEALFFFSRSSWAIKHGIKLKNDVAVFEADYYNNPGNEGEAIITLVNVSDKNFEMKKGDRFCQAVFQKILLADGDDADGDRLGGVGSTGTR